MRPLLPHLEIQNVLASLHTTTLISGAALNFKLHTCRSHTNAWVLSITILKLWRTHIILSQEPSRRPRPSSNHELESRQQDTQPKIQHTSQLSSAQHDLLPNITSTNAALVKLILPPPDARTGGATSVPTSQAVVSVSDNSCSNIILASSGMHVRCNVSVCFAGLRTGRIPPMLNNAKVTTSVLLLSTSHTSHVDTVVLRQLESPLVLASRTMTAPMV